MPFAHPMVYGRQKGSHAVYGEHPDRGISRQLEFPAAECAKGSECNFEAPAEDAAMDKIVDNFFHSDSIAVLEQNIQQNILPECLILICNFLQLAL